VAVAGGATQKATIQITPRITAVDTTIASMSKSMCRTFMVPIPPVAMVRPNSEGRCKLDHTCRFFPFGWSTRDGEPRAWWLAAAAAKWLPFVGIGSINRRARLPFVPEMILQFSGSTMPTAPRRPA
jgi:hypothetical protein